MPTVADAHSLVMLTSHFCRRSRISRSTVDKTALWTTTMGIFTVPLPWLNKQLAELALIWNHVYGHLVAACNILQTLIFCFQKIKHDGT